MKDILENKNIKLTEQQRKAVEFYKGVILLIAIPGAGKTFSIVSRISHLITKYNITPKKICNITFSSAAAKEMSNKYKKAYPELEIPHFSTIHSLSFQIVREYLKSKRVDFIMIEGKTDITTNKKNILRQIFLKINKEYPSEETTEQVASFISIIRNSLIDLNNEEKSKRFVLSAEEQFNNPIEIYNMYLDIKQKNSYIDFDDMLCIANNILSMKNAIAEKFKNKFEFIQVDEAQDISTVQYEIIKKLASHNGNLCLIGDDDQCIYAWRGADPSKLLNIKDDFPTATVIYMERNFRSAPYIVEKCNEFIKGNKKRYKKEMYTENKFEGTINAVAHATVMEQSKNIAKQILLEKEFNKTAILYRNNSSALPIILQCLTEKIPFNINVKENSIFKQFILDDIMSFYMFAHDLTNKEEFLNIAYKTDMIYVKKAILKSVVEQAQGNLLLALRETDIKSTIVTNLKMRFMHLAQSKNATEFLEVLFNELNYKKLILKKADENSIDILYALAENENNIEDVIEKIANLLDKLSNKEYDKNGLTLMTLHSSKGLEWKNVYLVDFSSNIIPNEKSELEEERRIAYVGYSRSISQLSINYYVQGDKKQEPSIFIEELLPEIKVAPIELLSVHNKISHSAFGIGTIIEKYDNIVLIKFEKYGVKKLNSDILIKNKLITEIN